jgi:hypothetical protein
MFTIIYTAVLTLITLILLHHLYNYLKNNLTIPKVNDVLKTHTQQYNEIEKSLDPMKEELQDYLKQFKKQT